MRMPTRRMWLLALALLGATVGPAWALKPEARYLVTPGDYGIVCDTVRFQAPDGVSLRGWFYPAQDTAGIANHLLRRMIPVPPELRPKPRPYAAAAGGPRPTVLICDGDAGNMSYGIPYCAYELCTHGFNVFTFDWRGFGESTPWPTPRDQLVCTEFLSDYDAAIAYVKQRAETDTSRIGLFGFSTGAYLSFAMLARHPDIAAFVGRAMPSSFADLLPTIAPLDTTRHWYTPRDYPVEQLPANAAAKITQPVFLIVGEKDERTPPWMSQKVYDLLKGPREIWVVPGAGHGGMTAPEHVAWEEFWDRTRAFFAKHLGGAVGGKDR
jgi:pimeloyl-ACP methyl ester carboxylesterase